MVTDREALDELSALRLLVGNSADMLSRHTPDGTYLYASPACHALLGYDADELLGRSAYELFHPEDLAAITSGHDRILESSDVNISEYRICHKQGHWVWFETTSHTLRDPATGEVLEIQASSRDVSVRKRAEARLRESEQRFRLSMANAPIGMALVGLDGSWLEVNARLCQILGRSEDELRALTFQDITHPEDLDVDLVHMQQLAAGEIDRYSMEKRYLHAGGHVVWILLSGSVVRDDDGQPLYFIAQIQDISERKRREDELRQLNEQLEASNAQLERDGLTGVYNRGAGLLALQRKIERSRRTGQPLALGFVDVDGLKAINDQSGHAAGDSLLVAVTQALTASLRSYDLVIRYGGDEFLCAFADASDLDVAERMEGLNAALSEDRASTTVSVGLAGLRPDDTLETLIKRADDDLYRRRRLLRPRSRHQERRKSTETPLPSVTVPLADRAPPSS